MAPVLLAQLTMDQFNGATAMADKLPELRRYVATVRRNVEWSHPDYVRQVPILAYDIDDAVRAAKADYAVEYDEKRPTHHAVVVKVEAAPESAPQPASERLGPKPWKLGGCSGREIHDADGRLIADVDLLVHAQHILDAVNGLSDQPAERDTGERCTLDHIRPSECEDQRCVRSGKCGIREKRRAANQTEARR